MDTISFLSKSFAKTIPRNQYSEEDLFQIGWQLKLSKQWRSENEFFVSLKNYFINIYKKEPILVELDFDDIKIEIKEDQDKLFMLKASMFFAYLKDIGDQEELEVCLMALNIKKEKPKIIDVTKVLQWKKEKMKYVLRKIRSDWKEFNRRIAI